jgi:hypothetical protein
MCQEKCILKFFNIYSTCRIFSDVVKDSLQFHLSLTYVNKSADRPCHKSNYNDLQLKAQTCSKGEMIQKAEN